MSPTYGSSVAGTETTLTFNYTDSDGYGDIDVANATFLGAGACRVVYEFGAFYLLNDAGNMLLGPLYPNSGASIENGYCKLRSPSVWASGQQLTLTLNLTFKQAFAGTLMVLSGGQSGSATTDRNGNYAFRIPGGQYQLRASSPFGRLTPEEKDTRHYHGPAR